MREIVDHFFPPVGLLVPPGGEQFTDFNYWRERPLDLADFTDSEDDDETEAASVHSEDEGSEVGEDLGASYLTQESVDEAGDLEHSILESVEGDYAEESDDEEGEISDEEGEISDEDDADEEDDDDDDDEEDHPLQRTPTKELPMKELSPKELASLADAARDLKIEPTPTPRASPRR